MPTPDTSQVGVAASGVFQVRLAGLAVLEGQPGPAHDIVALNAGAALYACGAAKDIAAGVEKAKVAIASGEAKKKLDAFVQFSARFKA